MSWREKHRAIGRRSLVAAVPLILLAGCGFRPLYAPPEVGTTDPALATIQVVQIPDRLGQLLTIALRDGFNPSGERVDPQYTLHVGLSSIRRDTALRIDSTATRAQIDVRATYQLIDLRRNVVVLYGSARSNDSIDLVDNEYANVVADNDARRRALRDIAAQIQTRCGGYLRSQAATK
jgi:LPS-assembly lipoprotein